MVRRALLLAVAASAATACGGGGGGDRTFDADGIGVTFEYPRAFHRIENITFGQSAGAQTAARAGVALDRVNAIIVSRYDLKVPIDKGNLPRYKGEVDSVVGELAGKRVSGRRVEYGGLPGYEYRIAVRSPAQGQSRMAILFDGKTEYLLNCQSTPAERERVEAGCRKALDTLRPK
jgi:hypothetical protein